MPLVVDPRAGQSVAVTRRWPIGAEIHAQGTHFRVWAPDARLVEVCAIQPRTRSVERRIALPAEEGGYFAGLMADARAGTLYGFSLDNSEVLPDPASRYQPFGPHGPSQVIDPRGFRWTDAGWPGLTMHGQVFYELHVGTFTTDGTWSAAIERLPDLAALGITAVEVMPLADFPGRFGWGYDGVNMFAPTRLYGTPDDFRAFVDRAHDLGMGVVLDVVYNHFGPDGNYLPRFSRSYLHQRHSEWGNCVNFDGERSHGVREFVATNAAYWVDEFRLDGLRLDATHAIHDDSPRHIVADIAQAVKQAGGRRSTIVVAENDAQDVRHVQSPEEGGYGVSGLWNDDFHHAAYVALGGLREWYFANYRGQPQEFISAIKHGYLYQGQPSGYERQRRGTWARSVAPESFVVCLENHDQIANSATGERRHQQTSPGRHRALTALLLLGPNTPLLFQGQEFSCTSPFLFFADHHPELAKAVRAGRAQLLAKFPSLATPEMQAKSADPAAEATFERCKLDWSERQRHAQAYALHRDLLALRRSDGVFRRQALGGVDGAVIAAAAFVLRFFGGDEGDRLLVVNLGDEAALNPCAEPLLAPLPGKCWKSLWSSEDSKYGGSGLTAAERADGWYVPAESATVLWAGEHAEIT